MEKMFLFLESYGWQLALIAFVGIVILGVLKYANAFKKVKEENRKPIYFAISVGFSLVATIIYLLIIGQFDLNHIFAVTAAIYALNQTMYSVYETTKLKDLVCKLLTLIKAKIAEKKNK
jgi:hypothetical protein